MYYKIHQLLVCQFRLG